MGRTQTVDLLIEVASFVRKANIFFNIKITRSKPVGARRSTY